MSDLFDVVTPVDGDGPWSGVPYDVHYDASGETLIVQDVCLRANMAKVAGGVDQAPSVVYTVRPFGVMVSAKRPNRCVVGDFQDLVDGLHASLRLDGVRSAAYVLWNGIPGWDSTAPFLLNSDVDTVSSGTTVQETVGKVLDSFRANEVGQEPILHMGQTAAMQLSSGEAASPSAPSKELYLTIDGTPIVVSPHYPTNTVAATGPIVVRRGGIRDQELTYDYVTNRTYFVANQVLAIEFDASIAVRAT